MSLLGIECGATTTSAILVTTSSKLAMKTYSFGPANCKIMSEADLEGFLRSIRQRVSEGGCDSIVHVGLGMPGIMDQEDKQAAAKVLAKVWSNLETVWVGSDAETAMACVDAMHERNSQARTSVVVIAGTGSNCFGSFCSKGQAMKTIKIGGGGHVLGDRGSSYDIALKTLRLSLRNYEHNEHEDLILSAVLQKLGLKSVTELISWSVGASKMEIASLATIIIELFRSGNPTAQTVVKESIAELAQDCSQLLNRLDSPLFSLTKIGLTGSLFTKNQDVTELFQQNVLDSFGQKRNNSINFTTLKSTAWGAILNLLKRKDANNNQNDEDTFNLIVKKGLEEDFEPHVDPIPSPLALSDEQLAEQILPVYLALPQTECRNERSTHLDKMKVIDALELFISEESKIYDEIRKQSSTLAHLIDRLRNAFKVGGRLFYVGAGTSGRLGILDATECPPTFRTEPEMVQGIMAGGFSSVSRAKEGAEDSIVDGMQAVRDRYICEKDVVIGIAASGRTPFVWGALHQAKLLHAFTAFLTFNTRLELKIHPDCVLAMDLGPEILTGSTRLKAGSATKCVLNALSTLTMVQLGKCFENLMVDLKPANNKLRQRSLRIVLLMTNNNGNNKLVTEEMALPILQKNMYDIKTTVLEIRELMMRDKTH